MYPPVALNQYTWVNRTHKHFIYMIQGSINRFHSKAILQHVKYGSNRMKICFLMPIRPSSVVVNFSIKSLISQKLSDNFFYFLACSFLRMVQCIVKIWIWLNHPKGHFERSERSNLAPFLLGGNFLKNCLYLCKKLPNEGTNELPKDGFD